MSAEGRRREKEKERERDEDDDVSAVARRVEGLCRKLSIDSFLKVSKEGEKEKRE